MLYFLCYEKSSNSIFIEKISSQITRMFTKVVFASLLKHFSADYYFVAIIAYHYNL